MSLLETKNAISSAYIGRCGIEAVEYGNDIIRIYYIKFWETKQNKAFIDIEQMSHPFNVKFIEVANLE